jgi:hypothetical protein
MVGYGEMTWARPSGSGTWPVIGIAQQRHGISLYVAAVRDGVMLAEHYRSRLGRTDHGHACIRFRTLADVDVAALRAAIRDAADWSAVQEERFGRACAQPVDPSDGPRPVS